MQFHFANEFTIEPCSFGDRCPAAYHFDTRKAARTGYDELRAIESASPELPIDGVPENSLSRALAMISSNEGQPLGYRKRIDSITSREGIEGTSRFLLELAQKGYLNGELRSTSSIIDGTVSEGAPELRWWDEITYFGAKVKFISLSLTLSEAGRSLMEMLHEAHISRREATSELYALSKDGEKLEALKGQMAKLLLSNSEKPFPKVSKDLWVRADSLLRADSGQPWTNKQLSIELGCSRQSATDTAQKLVARGIFEEEQVYDRSSGRYLKGYRLQGDALALLGGLEQAVGPKPE